MGKGSGELRVSMVPPGTEELEELEEELEEVDFELRNTAKVLSIRWWSLKRRRSSVQAKYNDAFLQDMIRRREERKSKVPTGFCP